MKKFLIGGLILVFMLIPTDKTKALTQGAEPSLVPECSLETKNALKPIIEKFLPSYAKSEQKCLNDGEIIVKFTGLLTSEKGNRYTWKVAVSFTGDYKHLTYMNLIDQTDLKKLIDFVENSSVYTQKVPNDIVYREVGGGIQSKTLNGVNYYGSSSEVHQFVFDKNNTLSVYDTTGPISSVYGMPTATLDISGAGIVPKTASVDTDESQTSGGVSVFADLVSALKNFVESLKNLIK